MKAAILNFFSSIDYKYILRSIIYAIKTVLSKPLFYLLLLFTFLCFMIIPSARMEISNIKVTRNGKTESAKLPYAAEMAGNEVFVISYDLFIKEKKNVKFNIIPNNCIQEILINNEKFPLDNIQGLCNYSMGVRLDFSKYVQKGLNHFEFHIVNISGTGGLWVEIPYDIFKSLSLLQYILILIFLLSIVSILIWLHKINLDQDTIYACVLSFPFVIYAFVEFCIRINYELSGIYQILDAPVYYAIGRGIVNGIAPWSGLWEIKPPGIFLVSAISFEFFDGPAFTYYAQVFVLILTAAFPIVAYFLLSNYRSVLKFALSILAGLLLALYSAERAGEFQVESFGAAFACLAVFAMAMPDFKRRKVWISLAAVGILGACGFKELFLFPLFGASLIFCREIRLWLWRFALPLGIALLLGFAFLRVCGWLGDFFQYFEYMFSANMSKPGSSFGRAMEFYRTYSDLNTFSRGFSVALLVLLFVPLIRFFQIRRTNEEILFTEMVFFGLATYFSSYAIGFGGEFFEHCFILAVPFYMALFLLLIKSWNGENFAVNKLGLLCLFFLVIGTIDLPYRFDRNQKEFNLTFDEKSRYLAENAKSFRETAAYLDVEMDEQNIDRYVFISAHTPDAQLYGWTRHSPAGPYFFQPMQWLGINAGDTLMAYVEKADAVVVGTMIHELGPKVKEINEILDEKFTKHQVNRFQIYFRKRD